MMAITQLNALLTTKDDKNVLKPTKTNRNIQIETRN